MIYLLTFAVSWLLTAGLLSVLKRLQVMDIPNTRSSHDMPTVKGGGLAFAVVTCSLFVWLALVGHVPHGETLITLAAGGAILCITGLIDDIKGLSPLLRFSIQLFVSLAFLYVLPTNPDIVILGFLLSSDSTYVLALLFLLWMTNLTNFMDGIDGIVALQTLWLGLGIFILNNHNVENSASIDLSLLLACAVLGFMMLNFPPAKIFMGDAGSAFLGFVIAALTLLATTLESYSLWLWLILLAGFICDATTTLVTRIIRGKKMTQAHRSHLYQLFVQHREAIFLQRQEEKKSVARKKAQRSYLLISSLVFWCWQFPFALLASRGCLDGFSAFIIVCLPLVFCAILGGAGGEIFLPYSSMRKK